MKAAMKKITDRIDGMIDTHGFTIMAIFPVEEKDCWFAYTVGLAAQGLPEIIVTGLPQQAAHPVLEGLAKRLIDGERLETNTPLERVFSGHYKPVLMDVHRSMCDAYMIQTKNRYPDYRAMQLVWPDSSGRLPWEDGTSPTFRRQQPILSMPN